MRDAARDRDGVALERSAFGVDEFHPVFGEHRELTILQENHLSRVGKDGRNVAGQKRLLFAETEDDRAAAVLGGDEVIAKAIA